MTIRPIGPAGAPLLAAGFAELSEESRDRRLFTLKDELDDRQLAYLTNVDHHDHEALVALFLSGPHADGAPVAIYRDQTVHSPAVPHRW